MTVTSACRMAVAAGLIALTGWLAVGCSRVETQRLPPSLERKEITTWTVEDHLAAALLYEKQARQLETEAARAEQEAATITPYEDPKEFRRSALAIVAQERRKKSLELKQLSAQHRQHAEVMTDRMRTRPQ